MDAGITPQSAAASRIAPLPRLFCLSLLKSQDKWARFDIGLSAES